MTGTDYANPDLAPAVVAWMIGLPISVALVWAHIVWLERKPERPASMAVPAKPSMTLTYCQGCAGLKYEWRIDWHYGAAYQCDRCRGVPVLSVKQKVRQRECVGAG